MRAPALATERESLAALAADWLSLAKPRIGLLVAYAAFTGGLLAAGPGGSVAAVAGAALLIGLVGGAASTFNQVLERDTDGLMERTKGRPLPAGRLRARDAILFGTALAAAGTAGLAAAYGTLAALLTLATLAGYALVYTPLKRHSTFNTAIGAIPGAMPPLLGYVAIAGEPGPWGWMLLAVLFVWQFPHFLAIAWLHRDDYRRAGLRMLPALPGSEGLAGRQAFLHALVLLPVSLLPAARGDAGLAYAAGAVVLGLAFLASCAAFARRETVASARAVLLASLAYLPLLYSLVLFDPAVQRALSPFAAP